MPSKVITIDGPSASGKGTLAKLLSKQINFDLLDSGALYRAFAFFTNQGLGHEVITKKLSSISFVLKDLLKHHRDVMAMNEYIFPHIRSLYLKSFF